ncbi:MAG: hypothetical protein ACFE9Z_10215 [Promethearchaeota archaeon]
MVRKDYDTPSYIESPLKQNWKAFLKAQPLVCDNCGNFTDTPREYCESCGFRHTLRKAKKRDFYEYKLKTIKDEKNLANEQIIKKRTIEKSPKSQFYKTMSLKEKNLFLKKNPYFCVKCNNFTDRPEPIGPQRPNKFYYETYCEICGSSDSIRVATVNDFKLYDEREQVSILNQITKQKVAKKPITEINKTEIKERDIFVPSKEKLEEKIDIKPSHQVLEISPKSDKWKSKLTEIPPVENDLVETEKKQLSDQFIGQKEEKLIESVSEEFIAPKVSNSTENRLIEESLTKDSQLKSKAIKKMPQVTVKHKQKAQDLSRYCKFCGIKLAMTVKYCNQCGTLIKYK